MKVKGKHIEFTKILTVLIAIVYYGFYLFSIFYWYFENRYMSDMITYIYRPFAIIVSCYTLKSGLHNNDKIKKNYKKEKKKKFTFSKALMMIIFLAFFISVLFFCISWVFIDRFPSDLFDYITAPFMAILPSYMVKAVIENKALNAVEYGAVVDAIVNTKDIGGGISESILDFLSRVVNGEEHDQLSRSSVDEPTGNGSGTSSSSTDDEDSEDEEESYDDSEEEGDG
jgi:hypothetical protein